MILVHPQVFLTEILNHDTHVLWYHHVCMCVTHLHL